MGAIHPWGWPGGKVRPRIGCGPTISITRSMPRYVVNDAIYSVCAGVGGTRTALDVDPRTSRTTVRKTVSTVEAIPRRPDSGLRWPPRFDSSSITTRSRSDLDDLRPSSALSERTALLATGNRYETISRATAVLDSAPWQTELIPGDLSQRTPCDEKARETGDRLPTR